MSKFLTYDLETTFLQKGQKRPSQRMLELALNKAEGTFHKLVNPCEKYGSGEELISSLKDMKQHPDSTLRFWTKLLAEKKALPSNLKRNGVAKQAEAISKLLVRSDIAKKQAKYTDYSETQWLYALENHHDRVNVSRQYLDKYEAKEKPKSLLFYNTKEALSSALTFGSGFTWVAHNGKSFDMPIVKGNCDRNGLSYKDLVFEDSLPMFRRKLDMDSYSQPNIYRNIFGTGYKAHHALDDARALFELLKYTAREKSQSFEELFEVKKLPCKIKLSSDLLSVKGIGQKSLAKFKAKGIHNKKQLDEYVSSHSQDEFIEEFKGVYRYKKLAHELYNTAVI